MSIETIKYLNKLLSGISQIPYENITKILRLELDKGKRPRNFSTLLDEYKKDFRGGTCFSLSNAIIEILKKNDISAFPIKVNVERETFPHFFVIIDFMNEHYLIDPGFMIYEPIKLTTKKEATFSSKIANYILKFDEKNNEYSLYSIKNRKKKFRYNFQISPIENEIFIKYWIESFEYINKIVASRIIGNKHIFISGNYVQVRTKKTIEKYKSLKTAHEYLINYFNFSKADIENAENVLENYKK